MFKDGIIEASEKAILNSFTLCFAKIISIKVFQLEFRKWGYKLDFFLFLCIVFSKENFSFFICNIVE